MFIKYLKQNLYLMQNLGKTFVKSLVIYEKRTTQTFYTLSTSINECISYKHLIYQEFNKN